jgi:acyl-CoA synthetase (AMP-forming)/AMP-acid ligase II
MLMLENRADMNTLLDAITLTRADVRPAITYVETDRDPIVVSRAEFEQQTRRYAHALDALGVGARDLVIMAHTQNLESIFAFWGALRLGAIPSMFPTLTEKLDPEIYQRSMAELASSSGVRAVLTTDEFAPSLRGLLACTVIASSEIAAALTGEPAHTPSALSAPDPDAIAFLQHSSGTTGLQKGVALSHRAVLNQIASYSTALELNESDAVVSWLPLYHDMGLIAGFLMPLIQGIPLILMSPFDWVSHPALLLKAIDAYGATLCWLPNFAYNHCARRIRQRDSDGLSLRSMRLFINCSEPVYAESHALFAERFAPNGVTPEMLAVSYAMAENTFAVTQTPIGTLPRHDIVDRARLEGDRIAEPVPADHPNAQIRVSCGTPIAGSRVRVVSPEDPSQPLPERHVGELAVQSDCMLTEYYRRPDLNPFRDGWYLTGDYGYIADGEVYVVGRKKDLIIHAGKNIFPQDIEAIVNDVPGVHAGRAVVFGVPDAREGTELIAIVAEVRADEAQPHAQISAAIRQAVARSASVSAAYVQLVDSKWLIKTSSGKIARAANRDKWLAERAAQTPVPSATSHRGTE